MCVLLSLFAEPFLEAVPQVLCLLCISFLSGRLDTGKDRAGNDIMVFYECKENNCGVASLLDNYFYLATFILSVISSTFGLTRFLKNGPMRLVPRDRFGGSFLLAMLPVALVLVGKGVLLAVLVSNDARNSSRSFSIGIWILCNMLPHFVYVSKCKMY